MDKELRHVSIRKVKKKPIPILERSVTDGEEEPHEGLHGASLNE
jgi:hypothetical protein